MFKSGDVVQLKSGGPKMVVITDATGEPPEVTCMWCIGDTAHGVGKQVFPVACLRGVQEGADD